MLDIQDLHIRFRNAPEGREAVKGISLHMDEGEILGLAVSYTHLLSRKYFTDTSLAYPLACRPIRVATASQPTQA